MLGKAQIIAVQKNTSLLGSLSNTLQACLTLPHLEYILRHFLKKSRIQMRPWQQEHGLFPSFRTVGLHKHAGLMNMIAVPTWKSVSKPSPVVWWWMCLSCSSGARLTCSEYADKYDLVRLQITLMHLVKEFKCLLSISLDHLSPWHQISCHHSVKHCMTICQTLYKFC
jgi:hypothetical protein